METEKAFIGDPIYTRELTFNFDGTEEKGRFELIYLGQDGAKFFIGYREFAATQFRHVFSETFTYKVPDSSETSIGYKDLSIQVYSVSNTHIEFGEIKEAR
jgi:hypothetical protein